MTIAQLLLEPRTSSDNCGGPYHFETAGNVTAKYPRLQGFDMTPHIGLRIHDVAIVRQLVEDLLLLIGEDDVGVEGLHHEQGLTQRSRTLTENLVIEAQTQKDQKKGKSQKGL